MRRRLLSVGGIAAGIALLWVGTAEAASDVWGNVGPASPLEGSGLFDRYPLGRYGLDQHFDAVSASLTGGVDVSGVPSMIAYFLASVLWSLTSFLANTLISLFAFAFSLDLLGGSEATGGAGALAPVSRAIHSIYADVLGAPWLVLAVAVVGLWAMWKALVQRRYAETAGALALSLIYVVVALFFVAQPGASVGAVSKWTNEMSVAFLSIAERGQPSGGARARDGAADRLFELLVLDPWVVLNFGGLEHCALTVNAQGDSDPESAPVRPLSANPSRDAALSRRLASGTEVSADGKVCVNNRNKYAQRFLRYGTGTDERNGEYDALDDGDASKLDDAARSGYRLGPADRPATDAMEQGGQYQRLLIAIVVFIGELGAFCLLGALAVGIILAQVLLLLLLAFAPVALIAAAIPGRGHAFFRAWLEKLAGYLLRKAAYSLVLAILLAVNGALAGATSQLGWLMSFGLQAFFFWAVFLQRKSLVEGLVGVATGSGAPGREGTLRLMALYSGARTVASPARALRRRGRAGASGGAGASPPEAPQAAARSSRGGQEPPAGGTTATAGPRPVAPKGGAGATGERRDADDGRGQGDGGRRKHGRGENRRGRRGERSAPPLKRRGDERGSRGDDQRPDPRLPRERAGVPPSEAPSDVDGKSLRQELGEERERLQAKQPESDQRRAPEHETGKPGPEKAPRGRRSR